MNLTSDVAASDTVSVAFTSMAVLAKAEEKNNMVEHYPEPREATSISFA